MLATGFVYILTNKNNTTLYTGVSSDLASRISEHISGIDKKSFSSRYNVVKLVYYEGFATIEEAIVREKFLTGKSRKHKIELIIKNNPHFDEVVNAPNQLIHLKDK
jgi:putative endonuclease